MALTQAHKVMLNRPNVTAQDVVSRIGPGSFSIDDLRAFAEVDPRYRAKHAAVEALYASLPDPEEVAAFEAVNAAVSARPYDMSTLQAIDSYLSTYGGSPKAAANVSAAQSMRNRLAASHTFRSIREQANAAIARHSADGTLPDGYIMQQLTNFVAQYSAADFAAADVDTARQLLSRMQGMFASAAEDGWSSLLDQDGNLRDIREFQALRMRMPLSEEIMRQADDKCWQWACRQPDIERGLMAYEQTFAPYGMHMAELARVRSQAREWSFAKDAIPNILEFRSRYPNSPFDKVAQARIDELKEQTIDNLRRDPRLCSVANFRAMLASGFDRDELMEAAALDEDMYASNIEKYEQIMHSLPAQPDRDTVYGTGLGEEGLTDIIFFGIASSGKTCVLSGLLRHGNLYYDNKQFSGDYGDVLSAYARNGMTVSGTPSDFIATIKAGVSNLNSKERFDFNLFEMAGEAFASIATGRELRFEDMGQNAAKIFRTPNDKVFFFLIDPTINASERELQYKSMLAMVNLMFGENQNVNPNADIMNHVKGLHFIVTKSDTLPEGDPREQARNVVAEIIKPALVTRIVEGCRNHGINVSNDSRINGHPRVFPFSLGKFTVGNMFSYDPKGSGDILQVICDYCAPRRKENFWYRLQRIFSYPII